MKGKCDYIKTQAYLVNYSKYYSKIFIKACMHFLVNNVLYLLFFLNKQKIYYEYYFIPLFSVYVHAT